MGGSASKETSGVELIPQPLRNWLEQHLSEQKARWTKPGSRHLFINKSKGVSGEPDAEFESNYVITSQYTWWNFLPKNLFEQFSIYSNLYFLFIGVLQMIPAVSTTSGLPTMYEALVFVVGVSALRAAIEDYNRHRADRERNSRPFKVLRESGFEMVKCGDLQVGDILKVHQDEMLPADLLLLATSHQKGHCFIDKANLNGETTLEVFSSILQTRPCFRTVEDEAPSGFSGILSYEPPNKDFDAFRGTLIIKGGDADSEVPLKGHVLCLRETVLRNTDYIYGVLVYTGKDTKLLMSSSGEKRKSKTSGVFRLVDRCLFGMFVLQFLLCLLAGIWASWKATTEKSWYLGTPEFSPAMTGFLAFWTWYILLYQMVPITLIVSSELVKFAMAFFFRWDAWLYDPTINRACKCNTQSVHEELGMVDYIFSDKTGTLTQNKMEFRYAVLSDMEFGTKETEIAKAVKARIQDLHHRHDPNYEPPPITAWTKLSKRFALPYKEDKDPCLRSCFTHVWNNSTKNHIKTANSRRPDRGVPNATPSPLWRGLGGERPQPQSPQSQSTRAGEDQEDSEVVANCFTDNDRQQLLTAMWANDNKEQAENLKRYMRHMALSNTVRPYEDKGELKFQADSAEELAMVKFARSLGFTKVKVSPTHLEIQQYGPDLKPTKLVLEEYDHVATFDFTSKRARVTIIYSEVPSGRIHVMCKGQDAVILPLLKSQNRNLEGEQDLLLNLKEMANNGLRTLVCAYAEHDSRWWSEGKNGTSKEAIYKELSSRETPLTEELLDKLKEELHNVFNQMEEDAGMEYMGCMGLEDQLQDLVPEAIRDFLRAGIKVWMITGDKLETAKNIGLACNLIDADMQPSLNPEDPTEAIAEALQRSRMVEVTGQWADFAEDPEQLAKLFALMDLNNDGVLDKEELIMCLRALKAGVPPARINELWDQSAVHPGHFLKGALTLEGFIALMKSCKISRFAAVENDIAIGIQVFRSIKDHESYPISLVVNRNAFEELFPDTAGLETSNDPELEKRREVLRDEFFLLASVSKSVVFAQARPNMKKRMVTEIQKRVPRATTLAIGDGANDVDMITAAHVGIGISGVEGTAATNSADYAVGKFRMLHTLLFVHGFWSYQRVSILILVIFYKASLLAFTGLYFGFWSQFSGQSFFEDNLYNLFNVVFTALPVMCVAWFDQVLRRTTCENNPALYREAKGKHFNYRIFAMWILRSIAHSAACYFVPFFSLCFHIISPRGQYLGELDIFSTTVFFAIVVLPNILLAFEAHTVTLLLVIAIVVTSMGSLFLFTYVISATTTSVMFGTLFDIMFGQPQVWFSLIVCVGGSIMVEFFYRALWVEIRPSLTQVLAERVYVGEERNQTSSANSASSPVSQKGEVVLHTQDEEDWVKRKPSNKRRENFKKAEHMLSKFELEEDKADNFRDALVRSLLRFGNLTGSSFDSCAQSRFTAHDPNRATQTTDQQVNESQPAQPNSRSSSDKGGSGESSHF